MVDTDAISLQALVSGGIGGVSFSALVFKLFVSSMMAHINTLKQQNVDCEERYKILRSDFTGLNDRLLKFMGEKQ